MSYEALKKVDKARDATIAFILKQIDKVDEELKLLEEALDEADDDAAVEEAWKEFEEHKADAEQARLDEKDTTRRS
jgi:hypothetical protein